MPIDARDVTVIYSDSGVPVGLRGEDRNRQAFGLVLQALNLQASITHTGTTVETPLANVRIPGGLLNGGSLRVYAAIDVTNNANAKSLALRLGTAPGAGTIVGAYYAASVQSARAMWIINVSADGLAQRFPADSTSSGGTFGAVANTHNGGVVNMNADTFLTAAATLGNAGDSLHLRSLIVEFLPAIPA